MLADADAGGSRWDCGELTPNIERPVGLRIEAFVLREATGEEDQDHRLRAVGGRSGGGPEVTQIGETEHSDGTGLHRTTSGESRSGKAVATKPSLRRQFTCHDRPASAA